MAELRALDKTLKRLLAMPKPELGELTTATDDDPWDPFAAGADPGSRRKWRNDVATAMVHGLLVDAGVKIVKVEGSAPMILMSRVLDCLQQRRKPRKSDAARKRLSRSFGEIRRKK